MTLKERRAAAGLTQAQLADKAGMVRASALFFIVILSEKVLKNRLTLRQY